MSRPLSSHAEPGRHRSAPTEAIPSGQLWPKSFLHSKLGWGSAAYCNARRAGLPTYEYARQQWVWTDDLIAFLLERKREGLAPPVRKADQAGKVAEIQSTEGE